MQDPGLRTATASEPLTLQEEYAMQQSWRMDHDKLTFIVCLPLDTFSRPSQVSPGLYDNPGRMIGDINLFLFEPEDDQDGDGQQRNDKGTNPLVGEIELMVAVQSQRRKGYGRTALLTFVDYVLSTWPRIAREYEIGSGRTAASTRDLVFLRVRINHTNTGSMSLFKSLGFQPTSQEPNYFDEIEYRWQPDRRALRAQKAWEEHHALEYR